MNRKTLVYTAVLITAATLAFTPVSSAGAGWIEIQQTEPPEAPSASGMMDAWQSLLSRLEPEQVQSVGFAFDDARRHEWFYTPVDRVGLRIGDLDEAQAGDLQTLLRSGLGETGTEKAHEIIQLEEVLYATSGGRQMRDPGNYYLMTFGIPTTEGAWAWRVEGHHFSASFTIVDDRVVSGTPAFFGGSPAHVPDDSEVHAGLRPFAAEGDLGFQLLSAFDEAQRVRLIIDVEAPSDVLTRNSQRAEMGPPEGIAVADMDDEQRALFDELMDVYGARMNDRLRDYQMAKIRQAGIERVHFAWAGATTPDEGHYYRIQGPTFVIEYDNTQNGANHVHSVWRDFEDDFGYDPLRAHLSAEHGLKVAGAPRNGSDSLGSEIEIEDDEAAHQRAHETGVSHSHSQRN